MRAAFLVAAVAVMLAFEGPLLGVAGFDVYAPDVALLGTLYAAWSLPYGEGLAVAVGTGLLHDAFSGMAPPGLFAEVCVLTYLGARVVHARWRVRTLLAATVWTAVFAAIAGALAVLFAAVFDRRFAAAGEPMRVVWPAALLTAAVAPAIFYVLDRLEGLGSRSRRGRWE